MKTFFYVIIMMLLGGCANDVVRDQSVKINSTEYSYIAFSTVCKNTPKVFMFYDDKGLNFVRTLTQGGSTTSITMTCDRNSPQYYLLRLPKGPYTLRGFSTTSLVNKNFSSMSFMVSTQQVNYLGRFVIVANARHKEFFGDLNYGFLNASILDEHQVDIAWFAQNYRNIPASSYRVTIPKIDTDTSLF